MRLFLALAAAGLITCSTTASAQSSSDDKPTIMRDCLHGGEVGPLQPTSKIHAPTYLYVATMIFRYTNGDIEAVYGWEVRGSLKQACDAALVDAKEEVGRKRGKISKLEVALVPDSVLLRSLEH